MPKGLNKKVTFITGMLIGQVYKKYVNDIVLECTDIPNNVAVLVNFLAK
jgi:hypothetical protein